MNNTRGPTRSVIARQVADALGVSISTVSRAFTPDAVIASATRRRVLAKAAELGYQPNAHARSLKTRESRIVAIVVSDLANPFYPGILGRLSEALAAEGFSVMLICRHGSSTLDEAFQRAFRYQPDVLVALAVTMSSSAMASAAAIGVPLVLFNRYVPGGRSIAVTCDNEAGGEAVADYLIDRGLTRPAYVAGDPDSTTNRDRQLGFLRACRRRGLPAPLVMPGGRFTHEAGVAAGRALLEAHRAEIDSVFCANDVIAMGVLDAAREYGVAVPGALSVIGFDDIAMAGWSSYRLTTYRQPAEEMIAATVDVINEISRDKNAEGTRVSIPGHIVTRATVRG